MRPVVRRRADEDAVVVLGEALDLHQRLAAAVRAGAEVRMLDRLAVEGADDVLRARGLQVLAAPAEVGDLLRMAGGEVGGAADVAGIGRAAGVAAAQSAADAAVVDRAGVAALAGRQELAVPAFGGHPDLETDVRVAGRLDRARDAASGGDDRGVERRCRHYGRRGDRCVRQAQAGKALAGHRLGGIRRRRKEHCKRDRKSLHGESPVN